MGIILLSFFIISSPDYIYVDIPKGVGCETVAEILYENGVIRHPFLFTVWARITGNDRKIKAGRYEFRVSSGIREALGKMVEGEVFDIKITIPEGFTAKEIASVFCSKAVVDSLEFMKLVRDSSLVARFGIDAPTLEGFLFPDTYFVIDSIPAMKVIEMMVKRFFEVFDSSLKTRMDSIGFCLNEIVTLASLVQSEAMKTEEMPVISSVYYNRLSLGRRLESCPTVLYILPQRKQKLQNSDLKIDSPYNPYIYTGLPPGAVCSPGRDALLAALYPEDTDYLYFVSKGDGTHIFSRTHKEHIIAKKRVGDR